MTDRVQLAYAEPAVLVDGISKRFRIYQDKPADLKAWFTRFGRVSHEDFWALRDVSFSVPRGSTFGLIGHNGSGKSTLLRLVARIHRPTKGTITTRGRLSALLALGAGFHPELTGRENIYLNGSILGLTRRQMRSKIGEIVEFAGLEEFIDAPVNIYSSGMYVRLGFSVAVHVDPEILIIDEVIAVGDEEFQRRCFDHMYSLRRKGLTILLVSHAQSLLQRMCDELAWIDHGRMLALGEPGDVITSYVEKVNEAEAMRVGAVAQPVEAVAAPVGAGRRGTREIEIIGVELPDGKGGLLRVGRSGEPLILRVRFFAHQPVEDPVFGLAIHTETGVQVAGPNNRFGGVDTGLVDGPGFADYRINRLTLLPGTYRITAAAYDHRMLHAFDVREQSFSLHVQPGTITEEYGLVDLGGKWLVHNPAQQVRRVAGTA